MSTFHKQKALTKMNSVVEPLPPAPEQAKTASAAVEKDIKGTVFDPKRHQYTKSPDGTAIPRKGKTGVFLVKKNRIRDTRTKKKRAAKENPVGASVDLLREKGEKVSPEKDELDEFEATAGMVVQTMETVAVMLCDEECKMTRSERAGLMVAWVVYFRAHGIMHMPPWLMVMSASAIYAGGCVSRSEKARARLAKSGRWIAQAFGKLSKKRREEPEEEKDSGGA